MAAHGLFRFSRIPAESLSGSQADSHVILVQLNKEAS